MKIENLMLGGILVVTLMFAGTQFIAGVAREFDTTAPISSTRYEYQNISDQVTGLSVNVSGTSDSGFRKAINLIPGVDALYTGLQIATTALSAMFSSLDVGMMLFNSIFRDPAIGLPSEYLLWIIAALGVMTTFAIIAAYLKWRP